MRFVSPLLKRAVYPALHGTGYFGRITPPAGYAVVSYHGVLPADHSASDKFLDGNLVQVGQSVEKSVVAGHQNGDVYKRQE